MPVFNLKKVAKEEMGFKNINNLLKDKNKETNLEAGEVRNINQVLPTKNLDNINIYEKQLEATRQGKDNFITTEKALEKNDKLYNDRRLDENKPIMPINLLAESYDQKHYEAFRKAEKNIKTDTLFWDKYIGVQMEGEKTKVGINIEKNQLENNPDRFKNINTTNVKDIVKVDIDKIASSLKDADALLFHIYRTASYENRNLNVREKEIINNINNEKIKILSQLTAPPYTKEDETRIVQQNGEFIVYDGLGNERWRTRSEEEVRRLFPDAEREY